MSRKKLSNSHQTKQSSLISSTTIIREDLSILGWTAPLNFHVFPPGPYWGHDVLPLLHQQPPAEQPGERVHQLQTAFHLLGFIIWSVTHKQIVRSVCTREDSICVSNVACLLVCRGVAPGAVLPGGGHRWWRGCVSDWPRSSTHGSGGCALARYRQWRYPLFISTIKRHINTRGQSDRWSTCLVWIINSSPCWSWVCIPAPTHCTSLGNEVTWLPSALWQF